MRIVERHFENRAGNDETYFLRCFSRARKFHKHGKSLDTEAELALAVSQAFWGYLGRVKTEARAIQFYKEACKVRCMINDHGATVGGYIVLHGELKALWCDVPGEGGYLVQSAIAEGARHLSCFDGDLVGLYSQFGFKVVTWEPNWTPGEPGVVTMELSDA